MKKTNAEKQGFVLMEKGNDMGDLIKRKDVLNIIHDYFGTVIDERTDKYKEGGEVPIGVIDDILSHNKEICTKIKELPAVDAKPVVHDESVEKLLNKINELGNTHCRYICCDGRCDDCYHSAMKQTIIDAIREVK